MRVPSSLSPAPQCLTGWQSMGEPCRVGSCPSCWMGVSLPEQGALPAPALQPGPLHTLRVLSRSSSFGTAIVPFTISIPGAAWELQSLHWWRELGTTGGCRSQCRDPGNLHSTALSQPMSQPVSKVELAARPVRPAACRSLPRAEHSHAGLCILGAA